MTLPSSLMLGRSAFDEYRDQQQQHHMEGQKSDSKLNRGGGRRQSNSPAVTRGRHRRSILGSRKSAGTTAGGGGPPKQDKQDRQDAAAARAAGRKGSFAQVSISGVKRLSHRLPLRKRHSQMQAGPLPAGAPPARQQRSPLSPMRRQVSCAVSESAAATFGGAAAAETGAARAAGKRKLSLAQCAAPSSPSPTSSSPPPPSLPPAATANDAATEAALVASATAAAAAAASSQEHSRDPIELGRQILDAYLAAKRQQELEQEEQERRRQEAAAAEAGEAKDGSPGAPGGHEEPTAAATKAGRHSDLRAPGAKQHQPLVKTPSSSRKSFRDFKHISRRLFMRHSSSKSIQVQQQSSITSAGGGSVSSLQQAAFKRLNSGAGAGDVAGSAGRLSSIETKHSVDVQYRSQNIAEAQQPKGRRLLRIKRSETVFEAATTAGSTNNPEVGGAGKLASQPSANLRRG
jgi:hypothetical protein